MGVTSRGYRAWRTRPISQRQRDDMILLAHIREQHHLSLGSYGRPRMTQELKENGINVVRTRKYKATTNSDHKFNIEPNLLSRNFQAQHINQKWAGDISYIWTIDWQAIA